MQLTGRFPNLKCLEHNLRKVLQNFGCQIEVSVLKYTSDGPRGIAAMDHRSILKTTIGYIVAAVIGNGVAVLVCHYRPPGADPVLVWQSSGLLICIPVGPLAVFLSASVGVAVGTAVALFIKYMLHRYQRPAAETVASGSSAIELLIMLGWAGAALIAYHLAELALFVGFSGMVAAISVLFARAIIHPELVDLHWLASQLSAQETAAEAEAAAQSVESLQ